jgi:hypothetical protein
VSIPVIRKKEPLSVTDVRFGIEKRTSPCRCAAPFAPYNDKHELQTKVARALLLQGA